MRYPQDDFCLLLSLLLFNGRLGEVGGTGVGGGRLGSGEVEGEEEEEEEEALASASLVY